MTTKKPLELRPRFNGGNPALEISTRRGSSILLYGSEARSLIEQIPTVSSTFVPAPSAAHQRRITDALWDAVRGLKASDNLIDHGRAMELEWAVQQLLPRDTELHEHIRQLTQPQESDASI